jgi:hypothetical protein
MKLDLLTNATVVDDAIRFISCHNEDEKKSKDPDYNEDKDQLEEKVGEITTNQVF